MTPDEHTEPLSVVHIGAALSLLRIGYPVLQPSEVFPSAAEYYATLCRQIGLDQDKVPALVETEQQVAQLVGLDSARSGITDLLWRQYGALMGAGVIEWPEYKPPRDPATPRPSFRAGLRRPWWEGR